MRGLDVLLRGRGAEIGVRAPGWLVRACGALLGLSIVLLAQALGVWRIVSVPDWMLYIGALVIGALLATSALGGLLWLKSGMLCTALMLVMFTPLAERLVPPFVRADPAGPSTVDAVVVLSGGLSADGRVTGQAIDRLLSGIELAKSRGVGVLALSIVDIETHVPQITTEADQRALTALMAPELQVAFVRDVHSTHDEALAFAALARTRGWKRVALVTSPMHTRRACETFEGVGLAVECRPAAGRDYSVRIMRNAENRRLAVQDVLYETAANLLYRSRGWIP